MKRCLVCGGAPTKTTETEPKNPKGKNERRCPACGRIIDPDEFPVLESGGVEG